MRQGLGCRMRQQRPHVTHKGGHCWLQLSKHPSQCVKNIILQIDSEHVSGSTEVLNKATSRVTKQKRNRFLEGLEINGDMLPPRYETKKDKALKPPPVRLSSPPEKRSSSHLVSFTGL